MDIKRVRRFGRSYAHPLIVLIAFKNQESSVRFGFSTSRAVGKAVQRNRAKRVLRAVIFELVDYVTPGWDVMLFARKPIINASFDEIKTAVNTLLSRANLVVRDNVRG
jgi:ribonuclease P protein component